MKRVVTGKVTKAKMNKTRRVEVQRLFKHPKYGKIVTRRMVCHVHDENNESQEGDLVQIVECRPLSKMKSWELVKVTKVADIK
jgi:small subunit ribosomal protein S17